MYKVLMAAALLIASVCYSQDTSQARDKWEDTTAMKKSLDNAQHFLDSLKSAEANRDAMQGINNGNYIVFGRSRVFLPAPLKYPFLSFLYLQQNFVYGIRISF